MNIHPSHNREEIFKAAENKESFILAYQKAHEEFIYSIKSDLKEIRKIKTAEAFDTFAQKSTINDFGNYSKTGGKEGMMRYLKALLKANENGMDKEEDFLSAVYDSFVKV